MDFLKTRVKAAAVANLTDARYFAAYGVDYLGFALEPGSVGYVGEAAVAEMREWIEGPTLVGEFGHVAPEEIARQAATLRLGAVQVGPYEPMGKRSGAPLVSPRDVARATGLPVLHEIVLGPDVGPAEAQRIIDGSAAATAAYVIDCSRNGLHWDVLRGRDAWLAWLIDTCADHEVLLDVPAAPAQLAEVLATLSPAGLQVAGGEEEAVGVKAFEELDDWFEELRAE